MSNYKIKFFYSFLFFGMLFNVAHAVPDIFLNKNQRAEKLFNQKNYVPAAELFTRDDWRGIAWYKAEKYEAALLAWKDSDDIEMIYNRGNAFARLGKVKEAIAAYDAVLKINPEHQDAIYNRNLLVKMQEQHDKNEKQKDDKGDNKDKQNQAENKGKNNPENKDDKNDKEKSKDKQDDIKQDNTKSASEENQQQDKVSEEKQSKNTLLHVLQDESGGLLKHKFDRDFRRMQNEGRDY